MAVSEPNGEAVNRRFIVEGKPVDFVIHPQGQIAFYYRGRWLGAGWVAVTVQKLLVDGIEPEGSVFNGTHQPGPPK